LGLVEIGGVVDERKARYIRIRGIGIGVEGPKRMIKPFHILEVYDEKGNRHLESVAAIVTPKSYPFSHFPRIRAVLNIPFHNWPDDAKEKIAAAKGILK
jgi:hypothetical protein